MDMGYEEEEEEQEDFSFPIFINTENQAGTAAAAAAASIDSPPLWHLSPAASPIHSSNKQQEDCFLAANPKDYGSDDHDDSDDDDEEEKMDVLWEDFNMTEELSSKSKRNSKNLYSSGGGGGGDLKLSKSYNIHNSKGAKPGIFVFIKLLKKLVLLHNSHHQSLQKNRQF